MPSRPATALVLVALFLLPGAAAFRTQPNDVHVAYEAVATPIVVATGELALRGTLTGGFLVGGSTATVARSVPRLVIVERGERADRETVVDGASLEVLSGALLWTFDAGALAVEASAPYGIGLGLPRAPIPRSDHAAPAGFLLAGERVDGSARWESGEVRLSPFDAVVTVRDAAGQPVDGWEARRVNPAAKTMADGGAVAVAFRAIGGFDARLGGALVGGATGAAAGLALTTSRASEDRFAATLDLLDLAGAGGAQGPAFAGQASPLAILGRASGILNGALVIVPGDGSTAQAEPLAARWGERELPLGGFNVLRGDDLRVAWEEGEMRIAGRPDVALGRDGVAVEPPARVGPVPLVSLVLWVVAVGAVGWRFAVRPPEGVPSRALSLGSAGVHVAALALALLLWDRAFTRAFGTGVLAVGREQGFTAAALPELGTLAGLELVPWGLAALFFALPVRIALGVALRYAGRGRSLKGLAAAGGFVVLAVVGPFYALWCFNLVWARVGGALGGG